MKKIIIGMTMLLLITGCKKTEEQKKQDNIIGMWETKYEMSVFGKITENYNFKQNGQCVRILNAGSDIVDECTYEISDLGIRIIWENKLDKESYNKYVEIDENTIQIGEHTYHKK